MSSFTDEPTIIPSNDGLTASVAKGFRYYIGENNSNRYINIRVGDQTDGMTLPHVFSLLRPLAPRWAYLKAVLVHDELCRTKTVRLHRFKPYHSGFGKITQHEIDREFHTALKALGMSKFKAWIFYQAVSIYQFSKALKQELNVI